MVNISQARSAARALDRAYPASTPHCAATSLGSLEEERGSKSENLTRLLQEAVVDRLRLKRAGTGNAIAFSPTPGAVQNGATRDDVVSDDDDGHHAPGDDHGAISAVIPTWKRFLDLTAVSLTWPVWLPIMIIIMAAIKMGSSGPVFYRQERVGYRGGRFMIFKFRTMKVNVETQVHESHFERLMQTNSPMVKLDAKGDPRLIRFGRFLRAAGLDELPQIFNVWRGEMSLVGPRPCTLHEFERYQPWQRERVNAPPGLTGFWQVNGKNNTTFSEMIDMDILYGNNMSLRLDLLILAKTIPAVVGQVVETQGASWWKQRCKQPGSSRGSIGFENSHSR